MRRAMVLVLIVLSMVLMTAVASAENRPILTESMSLKGNMSFKR